jgi:uncharacterized protein (TIGR02284 family)
MNASSSSTRSAINNLIETCKDGQAGFRAASEHITDPELKSLLAEFSLQRSKFAGELQNAAIHLGDKDPEDTGSVTGALHRGWLNLKGAIAGRDPHQILAECESGEDVAVKEYLKTLELDLPGDLHDIVTDQFIKVQATHDRVKALRDAAEK